jgi:DNA-binding transcriptional LysR family regulator
MSTSDLDWNLLAAFLAVMRGASLSAAARDLGLAQPTVRRKIETLEASTGVSLFTRAQNGLTPTEAAFQLLPHAQSVEAAYQFFHRMAAGNPNEPQGIVRLSASLIFATEILPNMLAQFRKIEPKISVELNATDAVENVLRREADVAIRLVEPKQEAILMRKVASIEIGLFASADYLQDRPEFTSLDALMDQHDFIWDDQSRALDSAFRAAGLRLPQNFSLRSDNGSVQFAALKAGLGVGVAQLRLGNQAGLIQLLPGVSAHLPCYVIMHEDLRQFAPAQRLFAFLGNALR